MATDLATERTGHRWTAILLGAALLVLAICTGLQKIQSTDYWWHLRTGYWIADAGQVPKTDVFTYTAHGAHYIDAHWLFQLGLAALHALGGHDAIIAAKSVLAALTAAILMTIGWRRERAFVTALGLGSMVLILSGRLVERPEPVSFVLLAAILALLERDERRGDAWSYAIVAVQLVWVNVHGLFALGIAVCAIYLLAEILRSLRGSGRPGSLRRLAIITVLVLLASLANPNFLEGALYPLQQLGMIGPAGDQGIENGVILELAPVWNPVVPANLLVLPALLGLACAVALVANRRHDRNFVAHALVFVAFLGLGLTANRNLALFAIVAAPLFVRSANEWLDRHPPSPRALRMASAATLVLLVGFSVDVARGSFGQRIGAIREPGLGVVDLYVSESAADWIERERPPGPIAHHMWYGGYLSWRLFPHYEVMVDGRLEIYGPRRLANLRFQSPPEFERLDARFHFGAVLLSPIFHPPGLIQWMYQQPQWRLVSADETGVLFVRQDPSQPARWPELDIHAPEFLPQRDTGSGPLGPSRRAARTRVLLSLGLTERAAAESMLPSGRQRAGPGKGEP